MSALFVGAGGSTGGDGIYVSKAKIAAVTDISGKPNPWNKERPDVGVEITLDIGRSFQPRIALRGNFKRDVSRRIVGWGDAFKIRALFEGLGIKGQLDTSNKIPPEMLDQLIGKEVYRLSYCKGPRKDDPKKPAYANYSTLLPATEGNDVKLLQIFTNSVKKNRIRNYVPLSQFNGNKDFEFPPSPVSVDEDENDEPTASMPKSPDSDDEAF